MAYIRDEAGKIYYILSTGEALEALDDNFPKLQPGGFETFGIKNPFVLNEPKPPGAPAGLTFLAPDPTVVGRTWVQGLSFGQIGYTNDPMSSWTPAHAPLAAGNIHQMFFNSTHAWAVVGENTSQTGSVWRSPLPNADGTGLNFVKKLDLAAMPNPLTSPVGSFFRPRCLAVEGSHAYVITYGTVVDGGTRVYHSADNGETWVQSYVFTNSKHGHAVRIFNGVPVISLGDGGFSDAGIWRASTVSANFFSRITQNSYDSGGNPFYGIDIQQMALGGFPVVATESDNANNKALMILPTHGNDATVKPLIPLAQLSFEDYGTNRCLIQASDGTIYFINTGENGNLSGWDSLYALQGPSYDSPVRLARWPASTRAYQDAFEVGNFICMGPFFFQKVQWQNQP